MVSSVVTPQKWKNKLRPNRYLTELSSQSLVSFLVPALNVVTLHWKFIKEGMVDKPMIEHLVYHKAWIFWTFFHCLWSSKRYITHPLGTPIGENCSRRIINEENMRSQNKMAQCLLMGVLKQFVIWSWKSLNIISLSLEFKNVLFSFS
jgi:hypothetical protein